MVKVCVWKRIEADGPAQDLSDFGRGVRGFWMASARMLHACSTETARTAANEYWMRRARKSARVGHGSLLRSGGGVDSAQKIGFCLLHTLSFRKWGRSQT